MHLFKKHLVRSVIFLLLFIGENNLYSQNLEGLRHCTTVDYKIDFYVANSNKKVKYKDTLNYYWFKSQKIQITQGRSAGDIIHGDFHKFYQTGQLAEQGIFKYGLKNGTWLTWYSTGKLKTIRNYSNGVLKGYYANFDTNGSCTDKGKFKKGQKKMPRFKKNLDKEKSEQNQPKDSLTVEEEKASTKWQIKNPFKKKEKELDSEKTEKKLEKIRKREERKRLKEEKKKNKETES